LSKSFGTAGFTVLDVRVKEPAAIAVGATAIQLCYSDSNRLKAEVKGADDNVDNIYIYHDNRVTNAIYYAIIPPGEILEVGPEDKREIWGVSDTAAQSVTVREFINQPGVPANWEKVDNSGNHST